MKKCLTIAGSDCSGGAGIQADLKAFSAHGCYGASVITSVVAENTSRVISVFNVPVREIELQIDAVFEDVEIDAVKLGMLPTVEIIKAVAAKLREYKPKFVVCDPVMVATSGDALSENNVASAFIEHLFPLADVITPNITEAETFLGGHIGGVPDLEEAARILHEYGAKAVLVKGGDLGGENSVDVLFDGKEYAHFAMKRVNSPNTHGTGCTLSSAIAANLALGHDMKEAVRLAKEYVTEAIEHSYTVGKGHSPVHHFYKLWS
ncbi:MAG: bifunctional hydroxymethylpyrimidine kinase/phosphomethylpyrimidine kinase [Lachnospiraceae bacterium]|nr:bifunctional hydroxymethylpyrimidine kinase/phosphomethylpyrimidine kinase [Ruminococcus sp.]MCM1274846.1 bifunctional hydroxymethylpyrimidine kinase/phosphomethylpyrimidine kinase [Lachnospiraceae bacterium]